MQIFAQIMEEAAARHGGLAAVEEKLPKPKARRSFLRTPDDRFLAGMTRGVFRAGFVWKVIEHKWDGFEAAFGGFDVEAAAALGAPELAALAQDERIVRNRPKIETVARNAAYILEVRASHGSFARYLADWPDDNLVGLFAEMKKRGARLGGLTGQAFLREMGRDTFIFTSDVIKRLQREKIIRGEPKSQRDLAAVQQAFNRWREESGRPLCAISRVLALSVD